MIVHSKDYATRLDDDCIQPNAVDIRVSGLQRILSGGFPTPSIKISEDDPKMFFPRFDVELSSEGYWSVGPGSYDFVTEHQIEIPEGACGWLIPRSTFARNGCTIVCGLYDSGYRGVIGGVLHNLTNNVILVKPNTRIGQFIMAKAESNHLYDGHYNQNGGYSKA